MSRRTWGGTMLGGFAVAAAGCGRAGEERGAGPAGTGGPAGAGVYRYLHLDVFTDRTLTGNQLGVFLEPAGLGADQMQSMARELNFSESTFIWPAEADGTGARLRIFGRNREVPFAGHPTIGSAFALAHTGAIVPGTGRFVFGEGIGPIPVDLDWANDALSFAWMGQQPPTFGATLDDAAGVAAALGVEAGAITGTGLPIEEVSCGSMFLFIPMTSRAAVDAVVVNRAAMEAMLTRAGLARHGLFVFSPEPGGDGAHAYSRMVGLSGFEDPATGSASGPLGCYLVQHAVVPAAEAGRILSVQGVKMNRPSRIFIDIGTEHGAITRVRVGGVSVVVGEGSVAI